MKLLALAVAAVLLVACEDVDRRATPTAAAAGVVVVSSEPAVPTAVAGAVARRERAGGPIVVVLTPPPTATATPVRVPTAVAGRAERRATPALDRRSAATATARAALERVVRPGVADEARRARAEAEALVAAGGTADAGGQVGADELSRIFSGLPRDEARCSELALAERGVVAPREAGLPVAGSARTEILLQQLEAGCFPEGAQLTPELARAIAARPPAGLGATGGAAGDPLGGLVRPATGILSERAGTAGAADRLAREDALGAPGLDPLPPRAPLAQDRPVSSRPPFRDTLRSAAGTGP
jgi:hypothetical protein